MSWNKRSPLTPILLLIWGIVAIIGIIVNFFRWFIRFSNDLGWVMILISFALLIMLTKNNSYLYSFLYGVVLGFIMRR